MCLTHTHTFTHYLTQSLTHKTLASCSSLQSGESRREGQKFCSSVGLKVCARAALREDGVLELPHGEGDRARGLRGGEDLPDLPLLHRALPQQNRGHHRSGLQGESRGGRGREAEGKSWTSSVMLSVFLMTRWRTRCPCRSV